jgi:hypothetical protein
MRLSNNASFHSKEHWNSQRAQPIHVAPFPLVLQKTKRFIALNVADIVWYTILVVYFATLHTLISLATI